MTVTTGMEMAMASGRFLQFTEINGRGELSCGGGQRLEGGRGCRGQADLMGQERLEGVCHLICLGTSGQGLCQIGCLLDLMWSCLGYFLLEQLFVCVCAPPRRGLILSISSPLRVLDLLRDEVEGVPSRVGEQRRVQGQCDVSRVLRGAHKQVLKVVRVAWKHTRAINTKIGGVGTTAEKRWRRVRTLSDLHQAGHDDGDEGDDFGVGEEVLDPGAPFDIGAVDKGQQT